MKATFPVGFLWNVPKVPRSLWEVEDSSQVTQEGQVDSHANLGKWKVFGWATWIPYSAFKTPAV